MKGVKGISFIIILSLLISILPINLATVFAANDEIKVTFTIDGKNYKLDPKNNSLMKTSKGYEVKKDKSLNGIDCIAKVSGFFGWLELHNYEGGTIDLSGTTGNVSIRLNGTNRVTAEGFGIRGPQVNGSFSIDGIGTLYVTTTASLANSVGIHAPVGDLKISANNVYITTSMTGVHSTYHYSCFSISQDDKTKSLIISGGNVELTANGEGAKSIRAIGAVNIQGYTRLVAKANYKDSAKTSKYVAGIYSEGDIKITGNSQVEVITSSKGAKESSNIIDYGIAADPYNGRHKVEIDTKEYVYVEMDGTAVSTNAFNVKPDYNANEYAIEPSGAKYTDKTIAYTYDTSNKNINIEIKGNGKITGGKANAKAGTEIGLTPKPDKENEFDRWEVKSGNISIVNNKFTMPNENVHIIGHFKEMNKYTLTVEDGTGSGSYVAGDKVTIRAENKKNTTFERWEVKGGVTGVKFDDVNSSPTKVEMPNKNVTLAPIYKYSGQPVSITKQPENITIKLGESPKFKIEAKNADNYQWQILFPGESKWINTDTNSAEFENTRLKASADTNGTKFRCIVSNAGGSLTSNEALVTVDINRDINLVELGPPIKGEKLNTEKPDTGRKIYSIEAIEWGLLDKDTWKPVDTSKIYDGSIISLKVQIKDAESLPKDKKYYKIGQLTPIKQEIGIFEYKGEGGRGITVTEMDIPVKIFYYTFQGEEPGIAPKIITEKLESGEIGENYKNFIYLKDGASGGKWSVKGNLPTGITLNATTGELSGTPTKIGIYNFTIKVENDYGQDEKALTIEIVEEIEEKTLEEILEEELLKKSETEEPKRGTMAFTDVPKTAWYYQDVKTAYERALIDGKTSTLYKPDDNMTFAEAVKLAACMHQLYHDKKVTLENGKDVWYSTYINYATDKGIIGKDQVKTKENNLISRKEYVDIFYNALPKEEYKAINTIKDNVIPDVKIKDEFADKIYTFYKAGILTGSDAKGTFNPNSNIQRSEVAAILTRMFEESARKNLEL